MTDAPDVGESPPLTTAWKTLRPHAEQSRFWRSRARFQVVWAGRRSGKTDIAQRKLALRAMTHSEEWPGRYFACAPTLPQAKEIFMDEARGLPAYLPDWAMRRIPRLTPFPKFFLRGGHEIWVFGMDKPQRIEGVAFDGGIIDEVDDMKPEAWFNSLYPTLDDPSRKPGWAMLIGRPRRRQLLYELSRNALKDDPEWADWDGFHWKSASVMSEEAIAKARRNLDARSFAQEYEASFEEIVGRAYYPFSEHRHCHKLRHRYNPEAPLDFCFDFNTSPGVAEVCQEMEKPRDAGTKAWWNAVSPTFDAFIGEVWIPEFSRTKLVVEKLIEDWKDHQGQIRLYGDSTGGAARTSSIGTDWEIIEALLKAHFGRDKVSNCVQRNPLEKVRVNAMNWRLEDTDRVVRTLVDPEGCPHLVEDFLGVQVVEGSTGEILKEDGSPLTHPTDAVGYRAWVLKSGGWESKEFL